jgi:undecaprenyl-diphosphatase
LKIRRLDYLYIFLIVTAIVMGVYLSTGAVDSTEVVYVHDLQRWAISNNLMIFFIIITYVGDAYVWIVIIGVFLLLERKKPERALKMAMFLVGISAVDLVLKVTLGRPRPFVSFPTLVGAILPEGMSSYPSGHVTRLGGEAYFLKGRSYLNYAFLASLTFLLALSRVALGVHYFTDTLGGFMIAYPLATLTDRLGVYDMFLKIFHANRQAESVPGKA